MCVEGIRTRLFQRPCRGAVFFSPGTGGLRRPATFHAALRASIREWPNVGVKSAGASACRRGKHGTCACSAGGAGGIVAGGASHRFSVFSELAPEGRWNGEILQVGAEKAWTRFFSSAPAGAHLFCRGFRWLAPTGYSRAVPSGHRRTASCLFFLLQSLGGCCVILG